MYEMMHAHVFGLRSDIFGLGGGFLDLVVVSFFADRTAAEIFSNSILIQECLNVPMEALPSDVLVYIFEFLVSDYKNTKKVTHPVIAVHQTCRRFRNIVMRNVNLVKNPSVCLAQLRGGKFEYAFWYVRKYIYLLSSLKPHKFIITRIRELEATFHQEDGIKKLNIRLLKRLYRTAQETLPTLATEEIHKNWPVIRHPETPEEAGEGYPQLFWPYEDQEPSQCNGLRIRKSSEERYQTCYVAFYDATTGKGSLRLEKPGDIYLAISECQKRFLTLIESLAALSAT